MHSFAIKKEVLAPKGAKGGPEMAAKTFLKTVLTIFTVLFLLAQLTFAELPRYEFIDLGTLGGFYSCAYSINSSGQIVGMAANSSNCVRNII